MKGKIIEYKEIAQGTVQFSFKLDEELTFKAGQYCFITLKELKYPDGRGNKRHFSIVNSPNLGGTLTFATRLTGSGFKKTLEEMPKDTEVELGPLAGTFTLPEDKNKQLVFIAGGIGITPFMSILKYVAEEKLPYKITLLYSNRNQESTAFFEEIQTLKSEIPNLKLILTMTEDEGWTGEKRKIDAAFIKEYFPNVMDNFYMVVGPPPMTEAVQNSLMETGVLPENIKLEKFTGY